MEVKLNSGELSNSEKQKYLSVPNESVYPKHRIVFKSGKHLNIFGVKEIDLSGSWTRVWDYKGTRFMFDANSVDYIEIKDGP